MVSFLQLDVIPEPVDVEVFTPLNATDPLSSQVLLYPNSVPDAFRFLSIFKWEERKGWKILIEAFAREFCNTRDSRRVSLHILTNAFHTDTNFTTKMEEFLASKLIPSEKGDNTCKSKEQLPRIVLFQHEIPQVNMPALYRGANAFVLPSRGEGWGRPHVEAMSAGLPVIATRWSGPSAFMTGTFSLQRGLFEM